MMIRCYGARGSIPVSGPEYAHYGGDTACLELRTKNDEIIIVDAGSGIRRLGDRLMEEERFSYHMMFTHSHLDHIIGFPFFKPVYDDRTVIQLLGCPTAQGNLKKLLSKAVAPPLFPVPFEALRADIRYSSECASTFEIDSVRISPINLSHPNVGSGYKFEEDGKSFVFLTDNELGYRHRNGRDRKDYLQFSDGAELLFHDAEYTPEQYARQRGWGHSSYVEALDLAIDAHVKNFGLFHHNQSRTDAAQEEIVQHCCRIAEGRDEDIRCFGVTQNTEWTL